MKKRTIDQIVQLEKAIEKKYGSDAIINPASLWSQEKEIEYLSQLKSLLKSEEKEKPIDKNGYSLTVKLITKDKTNCSICDNYGLKKSDEVYVTKFGCCEKCFILYIEGREEFWQDRKQKILEGKNKNGNENQETKAP